MNVRKCTSNGLKIHVFQNGTKTESPICKNELSQKCDMFIAVYVNGHFKMASNETNEMMMTMFNQIEGNDDFLDIKESQRIT